MDLIAKYADKIPGANEPGLFDNLISGLGDTIKYWGHDKIAKKYPDESNGIITVGELLLKMMKESNRLSYFVKDNEEVTGAVLNIKPYQLNKINKSNIAWHI